MSIYSLPQFDKKSLESLKANGLFWIIAFSLVAGFIGGTFGYYVFSSKTPITQNVITGKYYSSSAEEQKIIQVIKDISPAVVSIVISKDVPVFEQYYQELPSNPFFPFNFQIPQQRQKGTQKQEIGGGTGVIVSSDGIVLTNKHVVSDNEAEYTVYANDGNKYPAKVLALDPVQDLAIIKIQSDKIFPIAKLGDSDSIQIGQTAIAIGNALGEFRNTISVGVVSGLARTITASGGSTTETLEDVIQTDAAINQGNSGGPLINSNGEVIGINTATVLDAQSIGFSIPINKAKRDIQQVKDKGKIVYPFLGVRYVLVSEAIKEKYKLDVDYGAFVQKGDNGESAITSGSAAEKAGLKEGDIILEINTQKITADNSLAKIIAKLNPGDKITLKYLRDKKENTVEAVLGERTE